MKYSKTLCRELAIKHGRDIVLPPGGSIDGDLMIQINLPEGYLTDDNTTGRSLFFNPADYKMGTIWEAVYKDMQELISQKPWAVDKYNEPASNDKGGIHQDAK